MAIALHLKVLLFLLYNNDIVPFRPLFFAKPQSWGEAPRFAAFPVKFTPGRAGPPSAPPAPKTCTVTQTYKSGSLAVSGGGEGKGVVLLGALSNELCKS